MTDMKWMWRFAGKQPFWTGNVKEHSLYCRVDVCSANIRFLSYAGGRTQVIAENMPHTLINASFTLLLKKKLNVSINLYSS